jgi:hypothetical protein
MNTIFGGAEGGGGWSSLVNIGATVVDKGGDFVDWVVSLWEHEGGIIGQSGKAGLVPASVFAGAKRMHSGGLAGDEVPVILQQGELVVPKDVVSSIEQAALAGTGMAGLAFMSAVPGLLGANVALGSLGLAAGVAGASANGIMQAIPGDKTGDFQPWQADVALIANLLGWAAIAISAISTGGAITGLGTLGVGGKGMGNALSWASKGIHAILNYLGMTYDKSLADAIMQDYMAWTTTAGTHPYGENDLAPPAWSEGWANMPGGGGSPGSGSWGAVEAGSVNAYATGTDYVPRTGPYILHQGEAVIPAKENSSLAAEIRALRADLSRQNAQIARALKALTRWDADGMPATRTT